MMKIYSAIKIGDYHENNCEDHLYTGEYGKDIILCAIMDGCTTAIQSHFASSLIGKILKKLCLEKGYKEFIGEEGDLINIEQELKSILQNLLKELKVVKNQLMLDSKELLTTLIVMLFEKNSQQGIILAIGDGFVSVNGRKIEFEQDNKPDYLGFHLGDDFETFYNSQKQKVKFNHIDDISISSDGILTFEKLKEIEYREDIDVIEFLTVDKTNDNREEMLELKLKILENKFGLKPTDDFSIIRIIQ